MTKLVIDREFKRLIPPLDPSEREQLEANILAEGCRDPLVVWGDVLVDGHNRHEICTAHALAFETVQAGGIRDRESVREWILRNQLGRRNLSPSAAADLRGRLYRERKNAHGANQHTVERTGKTCPSSTAEAVADETGVSPRTVKNDAAYSEALDVLEQDDADIRAKVHAREGTLGKSLKRRDAVLLAKKPPPERREILRKLEEGEARNFTAATQQVKREQRQAQAKAPAARASLARIVQGDAVSELAKAEPASIDCVVTDPPYGIEVHNSRESSKDYADGEDYALELLDGVASLLVTRCKADAHLYVFSGYTHAWRFKQVLARHFDVQDNPLIWVKNRATLGDVTLRYRSRHEYIWFCRQKGSSRIIANPADDVLEFATQNTTGHSAEKPVDLLRFLIEQSTVEGERVCDPFCGSGSTGEAATALKRAFLGFELEERWATVARSRTGAAA